MVAVIGLKLEIIEELLNKLTEEKDFLCEIANDNCPGQIILSGLKTSVDKFSEILIPLVQDQLLIYKLVLLFIVH